MVRTLQNFTVQPRRLKSTSGGAISSRAACSPTGLNLSGPYKLSNSARLSLGNLPKIHRVLVILTLSIRYNTRHMGENHFLRRNWRLIVTIVTFMALFGLIYAIRQQIVDTFRNINDVNAAVLLFIIPLQAGNYHSYANLYR